jgi:hypothetical protein
MNHRRSKPRTKSRSTGSWKATGRHGEAPSCWNILRNNRPKRRRDKMNCRKAQGAGGDAIAWDLGNRRPHVYYW